MYEWELPRVLRRNWAEILLYINQWPFGRGREGVSCFFHENLAAQLIELAGIYFSLKRRIPAVCTVLLNQQAGCRDRKGFQQFSGSKYERF